MLSGSGLTFVASGVELSLSFAMGVEIAIASGEMDLPFFRPLGESMVDAWSWEIRVPLGSRRDLGLLNLTRSDGRQGD